MEPLPLKDNLLALQSQDWGLQQKAEGNNFKMKREASAIINMELEEPDLKGEDSACLLMHRERYSIPLQRVFFSLLHQILWGSSTCQRLGQPAQVIPCASQSKTPQIQRCRGRRASLVEILSSQQRTPLQVRMGMVCSECPSGTLCFVRNVHQKRKANRSGCKAAHHSSNMYCQNYINTDRWTDRQIDRQIIQKAHNSISEHLSS